MQSPLSLRISPELRSNLDVIVSATNAAQGGMGNANRTSVATALLMRAVAAHPAVGSTLPLPVPEVEVPPSSADIRRLRAVMGALSPGATDRAAKVSKGTVRNCMGGGVSLASAGGGALLAWVVAQEVEALSAGAPA